MSAQSKFSPHHGSVSLAVCFFLLSLMGFIPTAQALTFSDISEGYSNYLPVTYLTDLGIISGYDDGTFKPKNNINRAEALKILTLAIPFQSYADKPEAPLNTVTSTVIPDSDPGSNLSTDTASSSCSFPDVSSTSWFYSPVCTAWNNQVISGYEDGTFKPEQTITRIEALKIAILQSGINYQIPEYQTTIYNDTPENQWFTEYAKFAKSTSVFPEDSSNNLYPDRPMNRGEFAALVYRLIKFKENQAEFGRATYYGPGLEGNGTASGEPFNASIMAAAHKTLPFGTTVQVTNISNNKSVVVYINDRGPFVNGAVIDLTTAAFEQIATLSAGVANIELTILPPTTNLTATNVN